MSNASFHNFTLDRMDFDAIFQQIIALYISESRSKDSASRIFCVFIRPLVNFWQYFGGIPVFASIANQITTLARGLVQVGY